LKLFPMSTAPLDGTYILLFGNSGYVTAPLRCEVCHYDPEYRPKNPWQTHSNDAFSDGGGGDLVGWLPLPEAPEVPDSLEPHTLYLVRDVALNMGQKVAMQFASKLIVKIGGTEQNIRLDVVKTRNTQTPSTGIQAGELLNYILPNLQ